MAKIIVIHGTMGSGKSTTVSALVKKLPDYILVDKAYIKDTMLERVKKEHPDFVRALSQEVMLTIAEKLLEKGYNLILQETRAGSIKKHFGDKHEIISFYLHCSLREAKKRDRARQKRYIRPKIVEEMYKKHAHPDEGDISINTEKNSKSQVIKIILKNLT